MRASLRIATRTAVSLGVLVALALGINAVPSGWHPSRVGQGATARPTAGAAKWHSPDLGEGIRRSQIESICKTSDTCMKYVPVGFYKDAAGFVHLRGAVRMAQLDTSTAFTLPKNFHPSKSSVFGVMFQDENGSVSADGVVTVYHDGRVILESPDDGFYAQNQRWSFDGIVFYAK